MARSSQTGKRQERKKDTKKSSWKEMDGLCPSRHQLHTPSFLKKTDHFINQSLSNPPPLYLKEAITYKAPPPHSRVCVTKYVLVLGRLSFFVFLILFHRRWENVVGSSIKWGTSRESISQHAGECIGCWIIGKSQRATSTGGGCWVTFSQLTSETEWDWCSGYIYNAGPW